MGVPLSPLDASCSCCCRTAADPGEPLNLPRATTRGRATRTPMEMAGGTRVSRPCGSAPPGVMAPAGSVSLPCGAWDRAVRWCRPAPASAARRRWQRPSGVSPGGSRPRSGAADDVGSQTPRTGPGRSALRPPHVNNRIMLLYPTNQYFYISTDGGTDHLLRAWRWPGGRAPCPSPEPSASTGRPSPEIESWRRVHGFLQGGTAS